MTTETVPERKDIPDRDTWDLTPLFAADQDWDELYGATEKELVKYDEFKGHLAGSVEMFRSAIEFDLAISRTIERLYTYAHLKSDEDKANDTYLGMHQRAINLYTRKSQVSSFMTPEIQAIPDGTMAAFKSDPSMAEYVFYLNKILRYKPHTREEPVEQVLAMSQEMAQASSEVFGQLDNVDLSFGTVQDDAGLERELSHGNFITFLNSPRRDVRKNAFFQYYEAYENHKHTLAATFSQSLKKDIFYSRARNFDTCRQSALFTDDVPDAVYDNLIETVRQNLTPLFTYFRFRKEALGLDELHFYDTYTPIVRDIDFRMPFEEAAEAGLKALSPLGEEYTSVLGKGLLGRWVDRFENKGKRSGAYSSGCYDSPPYILMNYEVENINSLYTLIHEAGHSMHSYLSIKQQPYVYHDYTIFVAEVASTFNEILLGNYLLDVYRDSPAMKAYIINREIDNIRATLFRQTMFAEFEKITHDMAEQNQPLTIEVITKVYRGLLETYFGDTMVIDDVLALECLRIPHFYSAFYVYKYATGISAAIALARKVLGNGVPARDNYLEFLKLGGSKWPLEELLDAGVDMRSPQPVEEAIQHFSGKVDELIEVYKVLK